MHEAPASPSPAIVLEGLGLHTGLPGRVGLRAAKGPVVVRVQGREVEVGALTTVSTHWATTVEGPDGGASFRIAMVEHLFSALAGLGVYAGVAVEVEGPEIPLLDGCAARWCSALDELLRTRPLTPPPRPLFPPRLRVARAGVVDVGASRYAFSTGDAIDVRVHFEIDDPRLAPDARWTGDPDDYRTRIAPARTFVLARDLAEIGRLGLARHADPEAVVVVTPEAIYSCGGFSADEPARHKLQDLIGDLYLHGGPPLGTVAASRPGHTATAAAVARAVGEGILARS